MKDGRYFADLKAACSDPDGETLYGYIPEYTFNVSAISGHNGSDYGKIKAYNLCTGKWDQVAYKTTTNGVNLTGKLDANTCTQMSTGLFGGQKKQMAELLAQMEDSGEN